MLLTDLKNLQRDQGQNFFMTTDEIKARLTLLQEEINSLTAMLPDDTEVSFGTLYHTKPSNETRRKRLIVDIKEAQT